MTTATAPLTDHHAASSWAHIATTTAVLIGAIMLLLVAFGLPGIHSGFHRVPVAVVAPAAQAASLASRLETTSPGGFDVRVVSTAEQARQQILGREVYAALTLQKTGITLEVASAAGPAMATALTRSVTILGASLSAPVQVVDVRSFPSADPQGYGLSAGAVPLALGGWIAAVGIMARVRGDRQRLIAAAGFAVVGGLGMTAILQFVFGTVNGSYWLTSMAAMLGAGAASFAVLGLRRMFGTPGLVVAVVALILLGSPLSGLSSAPELLPAPWGALGQLLPPGATGTLLRNTALFDGASVTRPMIVLSCWLLGGLALFGLGALRSRSRSGAPGLGTAPAATS